MYHDVVGYRSTVDLESVNPKTFVTIQQQLDHKLETEGLLHRFEANGRIAFGALSYINIQAFRKHVKVRSGLLRSPDPSLHATECRPGGTEQCVDHVSSLWRR